MTTLELKQINNELMLRREQELKQARIELLEAQKKIENIIAYYNRLIIY